VSLLARAGAALVGFAGAALLVAGSQLPWRPHPTDAALVRLSWRASSRPVEECRTATAEELAALPAHMRREKICERRHAPFRLHVRLDGKPERDVAIEPAGATGDRPLYVFEELPVPPGPHRLSVAFEEERAGERAAAQPGALRLDASLELAPDEIALVTLDASGERLVVLLPGE
jgi:hypothetical protein